MKQETIIRKYEEMKNLWAEQCEEIGLLGCSICDEYGKRIGVVDYERKVQENVKLLNKLRSFYKRHKIWLVQNNSLPLVK